MRLLRTWPNAALALALLSAPAADAQEVDAIEPNRGGTMTTEARDPAYALSKLHVAEGYRVELWASELDFPLHNPVTFTFDARGRLWVATMPSYPQRLPDEEPDDKILILEDTDGDGRADRHTVFADGLHLPTGFELGDGGVYVAQQPNLMYLADSDGDDRADVREVVLHGFGTEDSHHSISAFTWGPGGGLYFQEGTFHHSQVETPWGPVRLVNAGVFRYAPKRHWLEVFVSYPFANPWGHVFDRWGQNFIADASGGANYFGTAITGNAPYPQKRRSMKVFTSVVRPTAGCEIVSSRHFPDEAQGNFLVNNTIGFQGIKQHRMIEEGSGFTSQEVEPLLYSTDINFRPVDLQFGPDGALYLVDWFNPLIGHMQYSLRDERRDHGHGRIWRVVHESRPLLDSRDLAEATIEELLDELRAYEDRTRYRARRELRERDRDEVLAALDSWERDLDRRDPDYEHHRLEALWLHQSLDDVAPGLLEEMLLSPEPRARAAATRVARFWRDRLEDSQEILERRLHDEFPRTRLEALLGLSYLPSERSARAALAVLDHDTDYYLDYVLAETMRTLRPDWQDSLEDGSLVTEVGEAGAQWLLEQLDTAELAALPLDPHTARALLLRADAPADRQLAAAELLARDGTGGRSAELVAALERADAAAMADPALLSALGRRLEELPPDELVAVEDALQKLAKLAAHRPTRVAARTGLLLAGAALPDKLDSDPVASSTVEWLQAIAALPADRKAEHYPTVLRLAEGTRPSIPAPVGSVRLEPSDSPLGSVTEVDPATEIRRAALLTLSTMTVEPETTFEALAAAAPSAELRDIGLAALSDLTGRADWTQARWRSRPLSTRTRLAGIVASWLTELPVAELSSEPVRKVLAFGNDLAESLATGDDSWDERDLETLQRVLDERAVTQVTIRAVPHQMIFDVTAFTVRAGRPVEIVLENPDVMPHNVVVTAVGALEDVGRMAEAMAEDDPLVAERRQYVPPSGQVLWATGLVSPGGTAALSFIAPEKPGNYPFVCTFPGHWIVMNGVMRVAGDADPSPELTVTRREITDELAGTSSGAALASRRLVHDWTLDELLPDVQPLATREAPSSESLRRGAELFVEVGCQKCHTRRGEGGRIGPELDTLSQRYDAVDTLAHILEPSQRVEPEYEATWVETLDGLFLSGQVVDQDDDVVRIRANPLDPEEITVVPREEITSMERSELSTMPSGLLSPLRRDEILDLLRWLLWTE